MFCHWFNLTTRPIWWFLEFWKVRFWVKIFFYASSWEFQEVWRKHGSILMQYWNRNGVMKILRVCLMVFLIISFSSNCKWVYLADHTVITCSISTDALSLSGVDDGVSSRENSARNLENGAVETSLPQTDSDIRGKSCEPVNDMKHVFLDEISCLDGENARGDDSLLDNCGILPGNCLPCLASTIPSVTKRRSRSSSPPPASRKKSALKLSLKWKDGNPAANLREHRWIFFMLVNMAQIFKFGFWDLVITFMCHFYHIIQTCSSSRVSWILVNTAFRKWRHEYILVYAFQSLQKCCYANL